MNQMVIEKRLSQSERLKKLFLANPNRWIPLPQITGLGIAMYPPRIKELREDKDNPMAIRNEIIRGEDGIRRSYYMYLPPKESQLEMF